MELTKHARTRLRSRFGIDPDAINKANLNANANQVFVNGEGRYMWYDFGGVPLILVVKEDDIVTVVSLEMAFANCPPAMFLAMMQRGMLHAALKLRAAEKLQELPDPLRLGITGFDYKKACTVWSVFKWVDKSV